jgi:hypothetical protein
MKSYKIEKSSVGMLPTLVTADWCPFTLTAEKFWMEATQAVGSPLKVLYAEGDEGKSLIGTVNVAGVPCLVAAPERLFYGINLSLDEAKSFLTT